MPTTDRKMADSITADHTSLGLTLEGPEPQDHPNRCYISLTETALLFAAHAYRDKIDINLFGQDYAVEMESLDFKGSGKFKVMKPDSSIKDVRKVLEGHWLKATKNYMYSAIRKVNDDSLDGNVNIARRIKVFRIKKTTVNGRTHKQYLHTGDMSYFVQKGNYNTKAEKNVYFLNCSGSPIKMLVGDNQVPIHTSSNPVEKAKLFAQMFVMPAHVIREIMRFFVKVEDRKKLVLEKQFETREINIQRIQLAAYTPVFDISEERDIGIALMYNVYHKEILRARSGIRIADSINLAVESDQSRFVDDEDGNSSAISGFLLKSRYGTAPFISMGVYAKDKEKEAFAHIKKVSISAEYLDKISRSIRLDLTIHTKGLQRMYKDKVAGVEPQKITYKVVQELLEAIFKEDIHANTLFKDMLTERLYVDQLFAVSTQQWEKALDYLKENGMLDLHDAVIRKGKLKDGDSWTKLCADNGVRHADRLRKKIMEHTALRDKKDRSKIHVPGVDMHFPYLTAMEARNTLADTYQDPRKLALIYEGILTNDKDYMRDISKRAARDARKVFRNLVGNGLHKMRTLGSIGTDN